MYTITRRQFGKSAAAAWLSTAAGAARVLGANDRVRLGFIGLGNRGDQVLDAFLAAQGRARSSPSATSTSRTSTSPRRRSAARRRRFNDYRRLLDRKDLDAVVISTPDHWHALQTIHACEAGKDVYVEKPLSLVVAEGRAMVEAARRHDRVVQVGIHRRSSAFVQEAAELVRGGAHRQGHGGAGVPRPERVAARASARRPTSEPPAGFDWDAWLGPAPKRPYNKNRTFYRFRWFYDYSGGQLTNFGVHYMDAIHWALGHDAPLAVTAMGGKFAIDDNREVPDTLEVLWTYPGGTLVTFSQFNATAAPAAQRPSRGDRVPRHQGDAVPVQRRLRDRAGRDHAQRVPRAHAARPAVRARLPHRSEAARSSRRP